MVKSQERVGGGTSGGIRVVIFGSSQQIQESEVGHAAGTYEYFGFGFPTRRGDATTRLDKSNRPLDLDPSR